MTAKHDDRDPKSLYRVQVTDATGKVLRHCGHRHTTRESVDLCLQTLSRPWPDGTKRPNWIGAEIRHLDGSPITQEPAGTEEDDGQLRYLAPAPPRP